MKRLIPAFLFVTACTLCGQIKDKVYRYMPLKEDLSVIYSGGERNMNAFFSRQSKAFTPDFKEVDLNQPRFWNGGLLMEPGGKLADRGTVNLLTAKEDPFDKSGADAKGIPGFTKSAFQFNGKVSLKPVKLNIKKGYIGTAFIFSFYAKGSGTLKVTPQHVAKDGSKKDLPAQTIQLTNDWKRHFIAFNGGNPRKPETWVDAVAATFEGSDAALDAAMVESPSGYFGIQSPTTYIPNGAYRDADRLKLPGLPPEMGVEGAIAFNMTLMSVGGWQSLITIGGGHWANELEMSYRPAWGGRIVLDKFRDLRNQFASVKMKVGESHHVILSYDRNNVTIYIDGKKVLSKPAKGAPFKKNSFYFGGRFIQVHSAMVYRNLTIFKKALTDAEAAELAKNPVLEGKISSATLKPASPFTVFPVNAGEVTIRFKSAVKIADASAKINNYSIVKATSSNGIDIVCKFDPAMLMPGKYTLNLTCKLQNGKTDSIRFPLEICNALRPKENLQINSWNENGPTHAQYGITMGSGGLDPLGIDTAARNGTYATYNLYYTGTPRPGHEIEDRAQNYKGKFTYPRPRSKYVQLDMKRKGQNIAALIKDAPTFMGIVLNSESHQGSAGTEGYDYSPDEKRIAKSFGIDLDRWIPKGKNASRVFWFNYNPIGNLGVGPVPEMVPASRSIPENNPLYAYHLERHSSTGGTDVVLNDIVAKEILKVRPDVIVTQDPILRRPYLRSYREINNAADWCYYIELHTVINLMERLQAVTRGLPNMTATTMPQFLFKAGSVAPYAGLPPADLFRGATYLAVSRPISVLTYWNVNAAIYKRQQQTADEIQKLVGNGDWKTIAKTIKDKKLKIFCFDPALAPELKDISDKLWYPFGALFPKWKNAPRRVAIVRSFASDLFGGVRWPGSFNKELAIAVAETGLPYDVLYDEDLTGDLSKYDMIFIPAAFALPEKGVNNLLAYKEKGGIIVVDERCKVTALSDCVRMTMNKLSTKEYQAKAADLLKRANGNVNTPLYIEGMQTLQEELAAASQFPGLPALVRKHAKTEFASNNTSIFWNHLQAAGADYLFVVNNLRIPGPIYGKFGKVREKGLPQKVTFEVRNPKFRYAYDMMARKEIPIRGGKINLQLGPCDGRIVLFTSKKLGALSANCQSTVKCGNPVDLNVTIGNGSGMIPVLLDVYDAAGKKLSLSRSNVIVNGKLKQTWTVPVNAPLGKWKIVVKELAKGQTKTVTFNVTK